jgi:hypothetical protein
MQSTIRHKIKTYTSDDTSSRCLMQIQEFVNKQSLDVRFRESILDKAFINLNPNYYHSYPYLFSEAFQVSNSDLSKLNIAGFMIFKHVMLTDKLLDEGKHSPENYMIASAYKEEGVKILSRLFPEESIFWELWTTRKQEYKIAFEKDKSLKEISINDFEMLADYKSAFGKVAIDSLHILSGNKNAQLYEDLLYSHKLFSSGVQLVDDIMDIREDLANGQFNMAFLMLKSELRIRNLNPDFFSHEDLAKQLYIFGIADRLFDKALEYYTQAEKIAVKYQLDYWLSAICERYNDCLMKKIDAFAYGEYAKRIVKKGAARSTSPIDKAAEYIESSQKRKGNWYDFYNGAGLSDNWATAFILTNIARSGVRQYVSDSVINRGFEFLNQNPDQLWGYNRYWIADADSTTFALLANLQTGISLDTVLVKKWLKYQQRNGGFSTYNSMTAVIASLNSDEITDVSGWVQSHVCVSAAAYFLLLQVDPMSDNLRKLEGFLLENVNKASLWDAYWWTSPIYSTYFMIKSLPYCRNKEMQTKILKAMDKLFDLQNEDMAYCQQSAYYISAKTQIDKALTWLHSTQNVDGSWSGEPVMRMPAPEIINPAQVSSWPVDTRGSNIRVVDFNRLFATSTALAALATYGSVASK